MPTPLHGVHSTLQCMRVVDEVHSTLQCTLFVDNFENNSGACECVRELSDLYACKMPVYIKDPGCAQTRVLVDFASLEHAFVFLKWGFPVVSEPPSYAADIPRPLLITRADAILYVHQFKLGGVFASWDAIAKYCCVRKITKGEVGAHNIGLIARRIFSIQHAGCALRREITCSALALWISQDDVVARCIAACLGPKRVIQRLVPYMVRIERLFAHKLDKNCSIRNLLYRKKCCEILVSCRNCRIHARSQIHMDPLYNSLLRRVKEHITWRADTDSIIAVCMGVHPVLGRLSILHILQVDIIRMILELADPVLMC